MAYENIVLYNLHQSIVKLNVHILSACACVRARASGGAKLIDASILGDRIILQRTAPKTLEDPIPAPKVGPLDAHTIDLRLATHLYRR